MDEKKTKKSAGAKKTTKVSERKNAFMKIDVERVEGGAGFNLELGLTERDAVGKMAQFSKLGASVIVGLFKSAMQEYGMGNAQKILTAMVGGSLNVIGENIDDEYELNVEKFAKNVIGFVNDAKADKKHEEDDEEDEDDEIENAKAEISKAFDKLREILGLDD